MSYRRKLLRDNGRSTKRTSTGNHRANKYRNLRTRTSALRTDGKGLNRRGTNWGKEPPLLLLESRTNSPNGWGPFSTTLPSTADHPRFLCYLVVVGRVPVTRPGLGSGLVPPKCSPSSSTTENKPINSKRFLSVGFYQCYYYYF